MSTVPAVTDDRSSELRDALAAAPRRYTYADLVSAQPETTQPAELWDGELIMSPSPSPVHQEVVLAFYRCLYAWITPRQLGKAYTAPLDMVLSTRCVLQPDVMFIVKSRLSVVRQAIHGPADLVVEVISPGGENRDRLEKRALYQQHGVAEYWIIDPEAQIVEVLGLDSDTYELLRRCRPGETATSRLLPDFQVDVTALFAGQPLA